MIKKLINITKRIILWIYTEKINITKQTKVKLCMYIYI